MKNSLKSLTLIALLSIVLTSCYSVKIVAPANSAVTLATAYEPLPYKQRVTNWYFLFGSVPISRNSKTDEIIASMKLEKVRVETKTSFGNILLNGLLNAIIPTTVVTNTTIIEGDIKRKDSADDQE